MRQRFISLAILLTFVLAAGCSTAATTTPVTASPTAIPGVNLTVMAAASLTESFTEIGSLFEAQHPGVKVAFNFAGSQQLVEQLTQGADADAFASASMKYMKSAIDEGLVKATESQIFARNLLVVIYPRENRPGITSLEDLAKPGIKLVLAAQAVPVGQYSLEFLDKAVMDAAFGPSYKDAVLKNVVSYEDNVKAVLTKIALGEADAGIVYVTDISGDAKDRVGTIAIPDALNTIATYPMAALSASKSPDLANAFVNFVLSPEGQAVMERYGFSSPK